MVCATSKGSDQPALTRSDQSFCSSLECCMGVKLLIEHHLEVLSLKGGCTDSSESTLVKMSNCWKSHATAQLLLYQFENKKELRALKGKFGLLWSQKLKVVFH